MDLQNNECQNYKICGNKLPYWWYDVKGVNLCISCHMLFGSWTECDGTIHT